jgi:phosphoglycolate phosphatase
MTLAGAILFDLDGTLLDTAPDMVGALNRLRREHEREPVALDLARPFVSHGAARLVRLGFPDADGEAFERLRQRFLAIYGEHLADGTTLFAGIADVLGALEANGTPWGVVTNKPGWLTKPLLQALGLDARAACVVSGDTVAERKPHPMPLLHAAAQIGVAAQRCVYIGDAERDIQAGRAARMTTIAAAYGYVGADEDLSLWSPDAVIAHPRELMSWCAAAERATHARPTAGRDEATVAPTSVDPTQ